MWVFVTSDGEHQQSHLRNNLTNEQILLVTRHNSSELLFDVKDPQISMVALTEEQLLNLS